MHMAHSVQTKYSLSIYMHVRNLQRVHYMRRKGTYLLYLPKDRTGSTRFLFAERLRALVDL